MVLVLPGADQRKSAGHPKMHDAVGGGGSPPRVEGPPHDNAVRVRVPVKSPKFD